MKSIYPLHPLEFTGLRTQPLARRASKVTPRDFARPYRRGAGFHGFLDSLPRLLAGQDLLRLVNALRAARRRRKPILWGLGGHVIKVGLAPVLIELMRRGYVSGIATTGAALIHDFEIALAGRTSEDVEAQLARGRFGLARETGLYLNEAAVAAHRGGIGLGEAAGKLLTHPRLRARHLEVSLLAAAYRARIPFTIHLALGTDIFQMHPSADGAALGAASYHDFRLLCTLVQKMNNGGVYLNVGSAVILPEVFLKTLAVVRGLGHPLKNFTTANLDFLQHYRPTQNVLLRPARALRAQAISLTAPHELLIPLLAAALIERT